MDFLCRQSVYNAAIRLMSNLMVEYFYRQAQGLRVTLGGFVPHQASESTHVHTDL
ncbi:hypothetical protein L861_11815 [Litchfieldella anticariensis FP35 = DSM 16096]|uniref:Uncharacterized protein n=1 Tax=Litchfieldella anticariensis (strain DSM 16096 / CECT 5854 / CIP 108499 / LMG 22089 / FP35) TaxID=1121939 RepID=S2L0S5_LITA3|nr:hypothetical protein L861_11815 [Halomonas anticariensis FP35 = DSM 16096]